MKIREFVPLQEGISDWIAGKVGDWRSGQGSASKMMQRAAGIQTRVNTDAFFRNLEAAITQGVSSGLIADRNGVRTFIEKYMSNLLRNYDVASTGYNLDPLYDKFADEYAAKLGQKNLAQLPAAQKIWQAVGTIQGLTPNKERTGERSYPAPDISIPSTEYVVDTTTGSTGKWAYTYDDGADKWTKWAKPAGGAALPTTGGDILDPADPSDRAAIKYLNQAYALGKLVRGTRTTP